MNATIVENQPMVASDHSTTVITSNAVSTIGFDRATCILSVAYIGANATLSYQVQVSEDKRTWVDVPCFTGSVDAPGADAQIAASVIYDVAYARVVFTFANGSGSPGGTLFTLTMRLGHS